MQSVERLTPANASLKYAGVQSGHWLHVVGELQTPQRSSSALEDDCAEWLLDNEDADDFDSSDELLLNDSVINSWKTLMTSKTMTIATTMTNCFLNCWKNCFRWLQIQCCRRQRRDRDHQKAMTTKKTTNC